MILTTEDAPPTNFTTDGGKTIIGSATEQIHELFKRAEIPYTIKMYPWQRAIEILEGSGSLSFRNGEFVEAGANLGRAVEAIVLRQAVRDRAFNERL